MGCKFVCICGGTCWNCDVRNQKVMLENQKICEHNSLVMALMMII